MNIFTFTGSSSGGALKSQQVRASSLGTVDLLDETGALLSAGANVDNLIYSVLSTMAAGFASGWTRKAAAWLAATSASATFTVTAGTGAGGFTITSPAWAVQDFDGFAWAVLRASGYEGVALSRRRVALSEGVSW